MHIHIEDKRKTQTARLRRVADAWLVDEGNRGKNVDDALRRKIKRSTEDYAEKVLLPQLGFEYVLSLNNSIKISNGRKSRTREKFPFDFYCEIDKQKWFIDVTAYIKKVLPRTPLWDKLGLKIGVLFVRRDLQEYRFKEGTNKGFVYLNLQDVGLEPVLSPSEVLYKAWETRRREGIKVKPLTEERKRKIADSLSGRPPWNKGLTKETDSRVS